MRRKAVVFWLLVFLPATSLHAQGGPAIGEGKKVKLQYKLRADGKVVEKTGKLPFEFQYGSGKVFPAFEKNIAGMKAGDKKKFELKPEEAFGPWDPAKARILDRAQLPQQKLKPGMVLTASRLYETETVTGRVTRIIGDKVGMDFNHPLAGKTLQFEVKVVDVQ